MSPNVSQNGSKKSLETSGSIFEIEDFDVLTSLERPRPVSVERVRSFDERSFSELSVSLSPRAFGRNSDSSTHITDHLEYPLSSPHRRSGFNTPRSNCHFESHPLVADAWEALRRSLVYFRGQPVGTIAAVDHSVEELNYDQVNPHFQYLFFLITDYCISNISLQKLFLCAENIGIIYLAGLC